MINKIEERRIGFELKKERKVSFQNNLHKVHFQKVINHIFWNLKLKFLGKQAKTFFRNFIEETFIKRVVYCYLCAFKVGLCFRMKNKFLGKLEVGRVTSCASQDGRAC